MAETNVKYSDFLGNHNDGDSIFVKDGKVKWVKPGNVKLCCVRYTITGPLNTTGALSRTLWDGTISDDMTISVDYKNADDVSNIYKPSYQLDAYNRIIYVKGGTESMADVIMLNTNVFIYQYSGFNLTDSARWGQDDKTRQLVGSMSRTFDVASGDRLFSNGFSLTSDPEEKSGAFMLTAIGTFLAPV